LRRRLITTGRTIAWWLLILLLIAGRRIALLRICRWVACLRIRGLGLPILLRWSISLWRRRVTLGRSRMTLRRSRRHGLRRGRLFRRRTDRSAGNLAQRIRAGRRRSRGRSVQFRLRGINRLQQRLELIGRRKAAHAGGG